MSKKILLLGGSYGQIPAIKEAKKRKLHTILCDYLPDNPGREYADEYHPVSTTDKEAVLALARSKDIDYILAYASNPAVPTEAYVAEKLRLPGNPLQSIEQLSNKELFRRFLSGHQFDTPVYQVFSRERLHEIKAIDIPFPLVIKPVDSSDTKGVFLVHKKEELLKTAEKSIKFSKEDAIIVEEFIDAGTANFHGDGFVVNGTLAFCGLGDYLYTSEANPLKPSSTLYPSRKSERLIRDVRDEVARAVALSGFRNGPINIEARVNPENRIYVMEIGPRSGGSYTPETIYHSTGFHMLEALFDLMLTGRIQIPPMQSNPAICFTLHSNTGGVLDFIRIDEELRPFLVENHLYAKPGDVVKSYEKPGSSLGALVFKFESPEQVDEHLDDFYQKVVNSVRLIKPG